MKKILIADDLPMMRTILKNLLSQLQVSCECLEASDGIEALRCMAHTKVDLVFLDWKMPNLSGIELLKKVRAVKVNIPVIMITGESGSASVKEAMRAGITDYIVKPVTKEILREKLVKVGLVAN
jgi:two-component system chemotaxis response regulator CheY